MVFTFNSDNDTITFADGLVFSLKFIHTHLKSPKGTIVEFLGPTEMGAVTMKTHPPGSVVFPPGAEPSAAPAPTVAELMALATKKT